MCIIHGHGTARQVLTVCQRVKYNTGVWSADMISAIGEVRGHCLTCEIKHHHRKHIHELANGIYPAVIYKVLFIKDNAYH